MLFINKKPVAFFVMICFVLMLGFGSFNCSAQEETSSKAQPYLIVVKPTFNVSTLPEEISISAFNKDTNESHTFTLFKAYDYEEFIYVKT